MGSYIINFTNPSNETGSVTADRGFAYTDNLNEINEANIKISSLGIVKQGLIVMGSEVQIKRNGNQEFYGVVDSIQTLEGGGFIIHVTGFEFWLAKENGTYANSPYTATASATIATEIITESNYFTAGTVEAGAAIDFRANTQQSLWNSLSKVIKQTDQDIQIDYANFEVDILDHRGSASSVATYNAGIQIRNVIIQTTYPIGNKVVVYGKGDGDNQIISGPAHGVDAGSQSTYGVITKPVYDSSIMSQTAADKLADALVPQWKDPTKIYDFNFINPNESVTTGDVITLNALDQGLTNEEVRIVGLERGQSGGGNEFLAAQVSNPAYKTLARKRNMILSEMAKEQRDSNIFMQGSGNFNSWGAGINAKTNFPLKVIFYLSANQIQDEAGNLRINSLTVDYDIDKFQQQYGTASYDGSDPQVQNNSDLTPPAVENNSGQTAPAVEDNSGQTQPDVINSSEAIAYGATIGQDNNNGVTCNSGVWTTLASVRIDLASVGSDRLIATYFVVGNSGGPEDIQIGVRNTNMSTGIGPFGNTIDGVYSDGFRDDSFFIRSEAGVGVGGGSVEFVELEVYPFTGTIVLDGGITVKKATHSHGAGSYDADNHLHDEGTYNAINHLHDEGNYNAINHLHANGLYDINAADINNISIGDDVGIAEFLNSSSVNLYLDFWNGSAWIEKHSILNTGVTLDTDVDITDGGTYPDAVGYWRVRFEPITATSDFAQGIVKLKNTIDN